MNVHNPYKGLFPYESKDEEIFFGRDQETIDLVEMIKSNQLVVIYGASGTGKTSLIQAKLFPELKRAYYFPIYIRLNYIHQLNPLSQLRKIVYSALKSWDSTVPEYNETDTLVSYAGKTSVFNGLIKPILFFDQFEELFTLGSKYVEKIIIDELITQLADLIEIRLPNFARMRKEDNTNSIEIIDEDDYMENVLGFRVVFSMRQDYIINLEELRDKIPSLSSNKYKIKKFTAQQAFDAIFKPAKKYVETMSSKEKSLIITEDTALLIIQHVKLLELAKASYIYSPTSRILAILSENNLVKAIFRNSKYEQFLQSEQNLSESFTKSYINNLKIDPTILSLYCYQLYEESAEKVSDNSYKIITGNQVSKSSCESLIKNYYNNSLSNRKTRNAIQNFLITPDGRRVLLPIERLVVQGRISEQEIAQLASKTAIVRIYGEGNNREIELAHDQIAKRALVGKKTREANTIVRNAIIVFSITLTIACIILLLLFTYVSYKEKDVNVASLKAKNDSLLVRQNELEKYTFILRTQRDTLLDMQKNYNKQIIFLDSLATQQLNNLKIIKLKNKKQKDEINIMQKSNYNIRDLLNKNSTILTLLNFYMSSYPNARSQNLSNNYPGKGITTDSSNTIIRTLQSNNIELQSEVNSINNSIDVLKQSLTDIKSNQ